MKLTEGIIVAAIACIPTVVTVICTCIITALTLKKELKRMEMAWDYKDRKEYKKEFAEMLSAVKELIDNRTSRDRKSVV